MHDSITLSSASQSHPVHCQYVYVCGCVYLQTDILKMTVSTAATVRVTHRSGTIIEIAF